MTPLNDNAIRYIKYLNMKMQFMADQEDYRWKLDVPKAEALLAKLEAIVEEKTDALKKAMPKKTIFKAINRPKVMHKKDGTLSAHGEKFEALRKKHLQHYNVQTFNIIDGYEDGNPGSHQQVKDWLNSLGWEPCTFDYRISTLGRMSLFGVKATEDRVEKEAHGKAEKARAIPQVRENGELTESVKRLIEIDPAVEIMDGLTVASHRASTVKAFLECVDDEGYLVAGSHGLTNTLRFKHAKPLVNLPGVDKPYGEEIRGCLIAPEGYVLCGADMDSLENNTKLHYMWDYDSNYCEEQMRESFDPHLDLAKFAGAVTQSQIDDHVSGKVSLGGLRKAYKVTNYSATYGIQPLGLSRRGGFSVADATALLDAFWKRNWSLEAIAKATKTKKIRDGSLWLYNPVSGFWYSLRYEKDKFSTLNQSTGVYCFDTWLKYCVGAGLKSIGQFHDEAIFLVKEGYQKWTTLCIEEAMKQTNKELSLNVELSTTPEFGSNYAQIH